MAERKRIALIALSIATTVTAAAVTYAVRVEPGDKPIWLVMRAVAWREPLAAVLLALTALSAGLEGVRAYLHERHSSRRVLERVVNGLAHNLFGENTKFHRITLFKCTSGWRILLWGLIRCKWFGKPHKRKALVRLKWMGTYLGVYVRPLNVRNRNSSAAFAVSDDARCCQGMAGRVWETGFAKVENLTCPSPGDCDDVGSIDELPDTHPVRIYAEATNIRDPLLLRATDHPARHFLGSIIRRNDGQPWGVLLVDSEAEQSPFTGRCQDRLRDSARMIGHIVG